ncbi:HlyD family type I secretion periplasmic adaptor subunit [Sphingopyxis sp. H115]|uniref:HlyD family type I secretion periplasmic adaptor subunit n=1 Tax=Sphingopyxis sp. H115 TaxID=1759073 RepID=UPI0007371F0F|nr:HlyD family type I secretion periplasmic adaptor subunit [Sphingopyxis sp. H115]KTE14059.1 secretion protein HylD [Sphingopyxis sp. H115]
MTTAAVLTHPPVSASTDLAQIADPGREIRRGGIIAGIFFILFLGWAAFFRLDAAAYAQGALAVYGQRQSVQHRDGGIVSAIHVREGDRVRAGQILVELASPEVKAQERAMQAQAIRLLAQHARLQAEQDGLRRVAPPPEFADLEDEADREAAGQALRQQQRELTERLAVLAAQRGSLGERAVQSGAQGRGYGEQTRSAREQIRLVDEQIAALAPLAEKGFVSKTRLRDLERQRAALEGDRGRSDAGIAQSASAASESRIQILEAERSFHERTAADLRDVETRLGELMPQLRAAREQLARTQIRSPATGTVVGLTVFTPGGVIAPGQKLLDIVPQREPLIIQARIAPEDADDLVTGQRAMIKFPGLHERSLPNLEGELTRLSADSFTDEKSGLTYFTGDIRVPRDQIDKIAKVRGRNFELRAGMPVEILIPLRKRTALDYALEPLVGSFWSSFREH